MFGECKWFCLPLCVCGFVICGWWRRHGGAAHGSLAAAGGPPSPAMSGKVAVGQLSRGTPLRAHMAWRAAHGPNAT